MTRTLGDMESLIDALPQNELEELRDVWLSRLMFNPFVGWPPETRSFEEFVEAHGAVADE